MPPRYDWDEAKRLRNLLKHGLDFGDAWRVHEAPDKMTVSVFRAGEPRRIDVAVVGGGPLALTRVYAVRGHTVRCFSLRRASRSERKKLDEWQSS
jgi:hypothetical protein